MITAAAKAAGTEPGLQARLGKRQHQFMKRDASLTGLLIAAVLAATAGARPAPELVAALFNPGPSFASQGAWIPIRLVYNNTGKAPAMEPVDAQFTLVEPGRAPVKLDYLYGPQTVVPLAISPGESRTSGVMAVLIPVGATIGGGRVCATVNAANATAVSQKRGGNAACFPIQVVAFRRILPPTRGTVPPPSPSPSPSPTLSPSPSPSPSAAPSAQPSANPSPAPARSAPQPSPTPTVAPTGSATPASTPTPTPTKPP